MIRVLLADDEELIRVAVAALLDLERDLEVVAQAADGRAAVASALAHAPTSPWSICGCPASTVSRSPPS